MWYNYLKIAYRNIKRNAVFTSINIFGLAVGLASCILIIMFINHELSYDKYHEKADRIFRVSRAWFYQGGETHLHLGHAAPPFGPLLKSDFEGTIQEAVRLLNTELVLKNEDRVFNENHFFFSDPEVFDVFSWKLKAGDKDKALRYPDGLVISERMAKKYFGDEDPMNKTIEAMIGPSRFDLQVMGVMEDMPENSHFKADFLASIEPVIDFFGGYDAVMQNFGSNMFSTYVLLEEGADAKKLENQLPDFIDRHISANNHGIAASKNTKLYLWPIKDIHLHSNLDSEIEPNSSIENIYIYSAIAFLILLIACINFMNMATARSSKRANEVGVRKTMGAARQQLIYQFIGETMLMIIIATVLSIIFVSFSLPYFANFTGKPFDIHMLFDPYFIAAIIGLVLLVSLVSGSYPAFFLSGFQPVQVLKGTYKVGAIHERLRSFMVVGQFAISIILMISVLIVTDQLEFMRNKDLGFEKDEIVVLPAYSELTDNYELLRDRLKQSSHIKDVALASRVPSVRLLDAQGANAEVNGELTPIDSRIADVHVSHSFISTFGMELIAGRDFDINKASDSTEAFIINESAVRAIGWSSAEEAIEKQFHYGTRRGYIVGVVKDFHFESLHQPISPLVFLIPTDRFNSLAVKVESDDKDAALGFLKEEWIAMRPDFPFDYFMISDGFNQQYEAEEKVAAVFGFFTLLAIIISILGLFGLTAYATEQRTKEIGIRKVLGASVLSIVTLIGKDFMKLVLIAFAIAVPIAWYGMNGWLENFAYRVNISIPVIIIAGIVSMLIAAFTISSLSVKAALSNPMDTLKDE